MRTLTILMILATTAAAGPGVWQVTTGSPDDVEGTTTGNAREMDVLARTMATHTAVFSTSDAGSACEAGAGRDRDTVRYQLACVVDGTSANHTWSIESEIHGSGTATTTVKLQGRAVGESLHAILLTGDHEHSGLGHAGAADSPGVASSLEAPFGLQGDAVLVVGTGSFLTRRLKKTVGTGTKCRVRVDSDVQAKAATSSEIGTASVVILAALRADLEMTGSCTIHGIPVTDRFRIGSSGITRPAPSTTTMPDDDEEEEEDEPEDEPPLPPSTDGSDSATVGE